MTETTLPVPTAAFLGGLFALLSSYGVDRNQNVPQIANISIALGAMYMSIFVVGLYGMFAGATQNLKHARLYAYLAAFATLVVIAAGFLRVVSHFVFKNSLLNECTSLTANQQVVYYGFWGPVTADISPDEAADWCRRSWDHDSWAEILALIIIGLLAFLFTAVAFAYYRQLLDPTSVINSSRAPSNQARFGFGYPSHYNPPYNNNGNGPSSSMPYTQYAPPAGPPPGAGYEHDETFVPPYDGNGKPPGYVGGGDQKGYDLEGDTKDPFADFDHERDVTSRPYPGGSETFRR
ncbi:hypothetical protein H0H93_010721 [Arthromyces matolae]|nr:hypothetical protein H0H93_010721 [Arthromyces matolae]